jgi:hypothetical protein
MKSAGDTYLAILCNPHIALEFNLIGLHMLVTFCNENLESVDYIKMIRIILMTLTWFLMPDSPQKNNLSNHMTFFQIAIHSKIMKGKLGQ